VERRARTRRTRLSSVANALRLVKAFSDDDHELGISGLAKRLGLAKSTVHRLATTLVGEGMLEQSAEDGKYRLGLALFELGAMVRRRMDFTASARPFLRMLMEKTGETAHLAILDHGSVLYLITHESQQAIRSSFNVGTRSPAHSTAIGKALLAFQPEEAVQAVIARGLHPSTPNTLTDARTLRREMEAVRMRGYAIDDEESEIGLRSIAAPIRSDSGSVIAGISISGPVHRTTRKTLLGWSQDLIAAADAASQRLGWQPPRTEALRRRA